MSHLNDEQLYQLVMQKDREALEELYNRYERILFSFIYRFTKDNGMSEEVMQDLFMKLWQGRASFQSGKGKFSSWILTIARNAAIDRIRKRKVTEVEFTERDSETDPETVEETVVLKEDNIYIQEAVSGLPDDQQRVVQLFYFEGETQKRISDICQIPLGTVKGRLRLALKQLRKTLSRHNGRGDINEQ